MTDSNDTSAEESGRKWAIVRRVGRVVGLLVLVAILIPFLVYAVPQTVGADNSYVVLSGSMQPTMYPGDAVIVEDVSTSQIESGDIITFERSGADQTTTHRVVEVVQQDNGVAYRTAGDNSEAVDQQLVQPGEIEGRVPAVAGYPFVIPLIGYVINFASTQMGFVLLVAVPLGLLILTELWSMSKRIRSGGETDREDSDPGTPEVETAEADGLLVGSDTAQPAVTGETDTRVRPLTHADSPAVSNGFSNGTAQASTAEEPADVDGEVIKRIERKVSDDAADTEESDDGAVTFTSAELELGLMLLVVFLPYSVWVSLETFEIWAFSMTGAVAAAFLLLSSLYLTGRLKGGESTAESEKGVISEEVTLIKADTDTQRGESEKHALLGGDQPSPPVEKTAILEGDQPSEYPIRKYTLLERIVTARATADAVCAATGLNQSSLASAGGSSDQAGLRSDRREPAAKGGTDDD